MNTWKVWRNCCRVFELCLIRRDERYVDGGRRNIFEKGFRVEWLTNTNNSHRPTVRELKLRFYIIFIYILYFFFILDRDST